MSSQKGNLSRSRPQKYKNQTAFKNDLHDKSNKIKLINSIEIANVCERCKKIIEWKIKYKKYKLLKAPAKCIKCQQKVVKHSYHSTCLPCAKQFEICAKCSEKTEIVQRNPTKEESVRLDAELQALLKELPERKRRTFIRYLNRNVTIKTNSSGKDEDGNDIDKEDDDNDCKTMSRDNLLLKLKSLAITDRTDDTFDSDMDDDVDSFF